MNCKSDQIRAAWQAGDRIGALRIAARFFDRSADTKAFKRGMDAYNNPDFYRQLRKSLAISLSPPVGTTGQYVSRTRYRHCRDLSCRPWRGLSFESVQAGLLDHRAAFKSRCFWLMVEHSRQPSFRLRDLNASHRNYLPRSARGRKRDGGSIFPTHANTGDPNGH